MSEFSPRRFVLSSDIEPEVVSKIEEALKSVYDPEIPVNIWDFGLIYTVRVGEENRVAIDMTLTTPFCPVADSMPKEVERKVEAIPEVRSCFVSLVWEPTFGVDMMNDECKLELGML